MKKSILKKAVSVISAAVMAVTFSAPSFSGGSLDVSAAMNMAEFPSNYSYSTEMRGLTAFQLVSDMGPGWNLGNSLESSDNETNWGNPTTTKSMIDAIAAKGFTTLRVPVRWDDHYSNASTYTIDSSFMDRVETVVNYGLANDMYVILNIHHNDIQQQVSTSTSVQNAVKAELEAVWTQVGNRFKNYGDKLIFETINEPRCDEDWSGNSAYYSCVNDYNEAARAAIRATGGNNASRLVMMPTYCASADEAKVNGWAKKSSDSMVAVSIHAYLPFDFAFEGSGHSNWLTSDESSLAAVFDRLNSKFISNGIPVVIGEFGACNKNNTSDRETYADRYASLARQFAEQDIPCVWWDNNAYNYGSENFGLFNRSACSFTYGGIADALVAAYKGAPEYEISADAQEVLASGTMTSSSWGQAVKLEASCVTNMSSGQYICADYSSTNDPELILQSYTNSSKGWIKVAPTTVSGGTARWSYTDMLAAFGGNFSELGQVYIGDTGASLTVTKVYVNNPNAHTHVYNGTETISLQPTATTEGRKKITCSVSGCDAYKVEVISAGDIEVGTPTLKGTAGIGQVALSWTSVTGATKYRLQRCVNGSSSWSTIAYPTATSYTDTSVTNGTTYKYRVYAYVGTTMGSASNTVTATPVASVGTATLSGTAGIGKVTLSWTSVTGATKYRLQRYDAGSGVWSTVANSTGTSYIDTSVTNGTTYKYRVYAYVGTTIGGSSNIATVTPTATVGTATLSGTAGNGKVTLSWTSVTGATKYRLQRYDAGSGVWATVANTTATSYNDTSVTNGTAYKYRVYAYVGTTIGGSSNVVTATPVGTVGTATLSGTAGNGKVTLSWTSVTGATKYRLQRYDASSGVWATIANTTATSYNDTSVTNGTSYKYRVYAYVGTTIGGSSNIVTATPVGTVGTATLSGTAGNGQVALSWTSVTGATKYRIQRYDAVSGVWATVANTTSRSYTDTTVTSGTTYKYRIFAYVGTTMGSASNVVTVTVS